MHGEAGFYYQGGSLLSALAVAAVIAERGELSDRGDRDAAVREASAHAIGSVSYGLYLWHWPVFLVVSRAHTGLTGAPLLGTRVSTTFAIALVSYRLLEQPIRRGRVPVVPLRIATPIVVGAVAFALVAATMTPPPPVTTKELLRLAFSEGKVARAHVDPTRVRILVLGDSVAWTLVFGLTTAKTIMTSTWRTTWP